MSNSVKVAVIPKCDFCKVAEALVDAKTKYGPWAYMCEPCWIQNGTGRLGTGFGQKLELDETTA